MELWQMDIVGGLRLADGSEAKIVSGNDDHSRFVISAAVVARATARPVCEALEAAIERHGVPEAVLTDNGKVFTARFGPGPEPVLFDRPGSVGTTAPCGASSSPAGVRVHHLILRSRNALTPSCSLSPSTD
jgi:hypothetical protein